MMAGLYGFVGFGHCKVESRYHSSLMCLHSTGQSFSREAEKCLKFVHVDGLLTEGLQVFCLWYSVPASFLLPQLLLSSAEPLLETEWQSCSSQPLLKLIYSAFQPPGSDQAGHNTVLQTTTLNVVRPHHTNGHYWDAGVAVRAISPSFHFCFICHYDTVWRVG